MNKRHGVALAVALGLMLSGVANAEEEEGKLELTEQQIQAAGIQLAQAHIVGPDKNITRHRLEHRATFHDDVAGALDHRARPRGAGEE